MLSPKKREANRAVLLKPDAVRPGTQKVGASAKCAHSESADFGWFESCSRNQPRSQPLAEKDLGLFNLQTTNWHVDLRETSTTVIDTLSAALASTNALRIVNIVNADVSEHEWSALLWGIFQSPSMLDQIAFRWCSFDDVALRRFLAGMQRTRLQHVLQVLVIERGAISIHGLAALTRLLPSTALRHLSLRYTDMSSVDVASGMPLLELVSDSPLRSLDLSFCRLQTLQAEQCLLSMPSGGLRNLAIDGWDVSVAAGIEFAELMNANTNLVGFSCSFVPALNSRGLKDRVGRLVERNRKLLNDRSVGSDEIDDPFGVALTTTTSSIDVQAKPQHGNPAVDRSAQEDPSEVRTAMPKGYRPYRTNCPSHV